MLIDFTADKWQAQPLCLKRSSRLKLQSTDAALASTGN
jgi:hypothetical protein